MKVLTILLLGISAFTAKAAADTFDFSFSFPAYGPGDSADSGSGTLTASYAGNNEWLVTGISGSTSLWGAITGLDAVDTYEGNDNLLYYPAQPYLDSLGISFSVMGLGDTGSHQVNVYFEGGGSNGYTECERNVGLGTLDVSSAPEPASGALVLLGTATAWLLRRRRASRRR
jgi:hypothetical protein